MDTFERLKQSRVLQAKGAHGKIGRWRSYAGVADLRIRDKWWTFETCSLFAAGFAPSPEVTSPEEASAAPVAAVNDEGQSVPLRQSNIEVDRRSANCTNQLDLVFRIVPSSPSRRRMQITELIMRPLNSCFCRWQTACKTVRGNRQTHIEWATGVAATSVMWETGGLVNDLATASCLELCLGDSYLIDEEKAADNEVSDKFFLRICCMLGHLAQWSMQYSSFLPGAFYLLLQPSMDPQAKGLQLCRQIWDFLCAVESEAHTNGFVASLLRGLQFPS